MSAMNSLRKAFVEELLHSSSSPRKSQLLLHSISTLQRQSSLYSTSNKRIYTPRKPKTESPSSSSSSSSSSSGSEVIQKKSPLHGSQTQEEREIEIPTSDFPKPRYKKESEIELPTSDWSKLREIKWKEEISSLVQNRAPLPASQMKEDREMGIPTSDWPKPSEIPWQTKVANSVNLIGHVQIPVQFQASADGKFWAGTIISQHQENNEDSVNSDSDSPSFWIPLIFEGDLAHIAACHLKEKDRVYIEGQLTADPPPFTMSHGQANVQVMVRGINFVQCASQLKKSFAPFKKSFAPFKKEQRTTDRSASEMKDGDSWRDLLRNPNQWSDHREKKLNGLVKPKYPDFKHKDNGLALWLDSAPKWVLSEIEGLESIDQPRNPKQVKECKGDDSWKNLVENPDRWWDNRSNKINKKSPDFKHKDTGDALWLSSSPAWVLPRLPPLKAKQNATFGKRETLLS